MSDLTTKSTKNHTEGRGGSEAVLKLSAGNQMEQRVLDYLQENASDVLIWKINTTKKTLAGALEYAKGEARKLAQGSNCVCVDDETVFGWIIHFFEEDSIKEPAGAKKTAVRTPGGVKQKPKVPAKANSEKKRSNILELFSAEELGL